ncbi:MAG: hypothetical protein HKN63_03385 [Rhodobacteraceae bacterium]|nr:hypothetical protein [Paracoccaceae bacterium]
MSVPARLHVITAANAPAAIILRRGPAGEVATIGWNRENDSFEMGQWLKGRIYEYRCDLSPDGRHFVYFAGKGGTHYWTGVSRSPWLFADYLLPQDSTWGGGGKFTPDGALWGLGSGPEKAQDMNLPEFTSKADAMPGSTNGFHGGNTYATAMTFRGWSHVSGDRCDAILTKNIDKDWTLELGFALSAKNRAIISSRYALLDSKTSARIECPDWEWADLWKNDLQYAAKGALWSCRLNKDGSQRDVTVIRDFNDMRFEAIKAPFDPTPDFEAKT